MYAKIAISACRLVSHDRRQISSALMVLKNVSTIARQTICKANLPRGGGVVVAIALAAHGYLEAMLAQDLLIIVGTILAAPVGMVDAALWRLTERDGHPLTGRALPSNVPRGFKALIARSRFMRLLTAQPMTRSECKSKMTARYSQPSRVQM